MAILMGLFGQIRQVIRFLLGWLVTIIMSSLQLIAGFAGVGRWSWEMIPHYWAVMVFAIMGTRVNVVGGKNIGIQGVYVLNHQSLLDVVLVPYMLPRKILYVVKAELAKVPIFGAAVCRLGAIKVDRRNTSSAVKSIRKGLDDMPEGYSILVFPEGTRSSDGTLGQFKKGFAHIAFLGKLPIIPIGIAGAIESCPANCIVPRPGLLECTVGAPIATNDWTVENLNEKVQMVRGVVRELQLASEERRAAHSVSASAPIPANSSHEA